MWRNKPKESLDMLDNMLYHTIMKKEMDLIEQLEEYRLKNRMSQEKLARKLDVSFQTVNRWLNRLSKPSKIHEYHIKKLLEGNRK
ncbi:helix-turn-helix transcriptional regulator [Candidatus Eisenbacteria bacterium]|uniref:Helix-turn-helix transcriptional regulator n=1 Tax=Eiseniibacteriota bacterium TaxID=2212470 RepID=A0ABV6YNI0_UNCEI